MSFTFSQYKDAADFLSKYPEMDRKTAIKFLNLELQKMEEVT